MQFMIDDLSSTKSFHNFKNWNFKIMNIELLTFIPGHHSLFHIHSMFTLISSALRHCNFDHPLKHFQLETHSWISIKYMKFIGSKWRTLSLSKATEKVTWFNSISLLFRYHFKYLWLCMRMLHLFVDEVAKRLRYDDVRFIFQSTYRQLIITVIIRP